MSNAVQTHFDERASYYDNNRRYLIPHFDEYYSIGVEALACQKITPRVLDLGGGTGLSTLYLLKRFPNARVTLLDFSEEMLGVARERFSDNPNIDCVVGDYRSLSLEGPFDVVISGLSIHHLDFEEKQTLTNTIYSLLFDGGEFINADLVKSECDLIERKMHLRLETFLAENLSQEQIQSFDDSQQLDLPVSIAEHFELLTSAGFKKADCLFRCWIYGVFYGQK